jgi:endo-alpha-1,4-polygalactosaminidase (GH114 family)
VEKQVIEIGIPEENQTLIDSIQKEVAEIDGYKIETEEQYVNAANLTKKVKGRYAEIDAMKKSITKPLNDAVKAIDAFFNPSLQKLKSVEDFLKRGSEAFYAEMKRKQEEEQRKAYEEAKKEQERKRIQLESQAQKAEAAGKSEKAQSLFERAESVHVPVQVVQKTPPKVGGVKFVPQWKYRVVDASKIPVKYMVINDRMLSDIAKAGKGMVDVPGVEFYCEEKMYSGKA